MNIFFKWLFKKEMSKFRKNDLQSLITALKIAEYDECVESLFAIPNTWTGMSELRKLKQRSEQLKVDYPGLKKLEKSLLELKAHSEVYYQQSHKYNEDMPNVILKHHIPHLLKLIQKT